MHLQALLFKRKPDGDVEVPVRRPDGDVELQDAGESCSITIQLQLMYAAVVL